MSFDENLAHLLKLEKKQRVELEQRIEVILYGLPLMVPEAKL